MPFGVALNPRKLSRLTIDMSQQVLLIRTDASISMGTGHAMRCLALAQAWQDAGGRATFAMAESTAAVQGWLRKNGFDVVVLDVTIGTARDVEETLRLASKIESSWVILDGYSFGSQYQAILKSNGFRVLFVDDYGHAENYTADIILNQNVHANEGLYRKRDVGTRLLLGPEFTALRREFNSWRGWRRQVRATCRRILVTMGGSDPDNLTAIVIQAIQSRQDLEANVVVGGSNPHLNQLRGMVRNTRAGVTLLENVSNMPDLIAAADVVVSGAGTTTLELSFLGLPALLVVLAENQRAVAEELSRRGVAVNLGDGAQLEPARIAEQLESLMTSSESRQAMSDRGQRLVDGLGAQRILRAMHWAVLHIRRASSSDGRILWELLNDPEARASSFSEALIPWEHHLAWFEAKIRSSACHMLIAEAEGVVIGQVRVDVRADGDGEVDISVGRAFRGQGVGSRLINLGVHEIFASTGMPRIHAFIRFENIASRRAFEKAGFQNAGEENVKGHRALHYVRNRTDEILQTCLEERTNHDE
jgi:UDP-2,4-diacetamido-2,4,6-trideoxy-beta-L-altropyranose hydrolase